MGMNKSMKMSYSERKERVEEKLEFHTEVE